VETQESSQREHNGSKIKLQLLFSFYQAILRIWRLSIQENT